MLSALKLDDSAEFALFASEKDMHKAILIQPSLIEEGFKPISYEKKVAPGFIDVFGIDKNGKLVVIEVKRKIAGKEAVIQLANYVSAIRGEPVPVIIKGRVAGLPRPANAGAKS